MRIMVVGAGVVGLAVARAAALAGHDVVVAEQTSGIGNGISSRNSEVIHAGIYYPTGSLRARHCVAGRQLLYEYCGSRGVAHRKCGKLIVAPTPQEVTRIEAILRQGLANGVDGLELIDGASVRELEPALSCTAAVVSRETGIIDSHALMLALQGDLEDHGGMIAFQTTVDRLARGPDDWVVHFTGNAAGALSFDGVINATGLGAQRLARATEGYPAHRVPRLVFAKGNYFAYAGRPVFRRLIYPAPVEGGLGVHVTLDLAGRMRFGPDVEWVDEENYAVDARRADLFYDAIRGYWPGLPPGSLLPDYAGIRPKLTGPGEKAADFVIDGPAEHGLPRLIHLFGIESPGLTSSLSIAQQVVEQITGSGP